ncbi:hypothetical protein HU200_034098 [Digitaria exilis]|uniref:Uncharacterized protein n=1 Tax=Digitaria exilis TaxID=1010633 RepID=A0A835BHB2_9POAL|nr:hypothetical protein HU200_034098 [Digitaria exilis]
MADKLRRLRSVGVVITGLGRNYLPETEEMKEVLHQKLCIPLHHIQVSRHKPEDFFAHFDHPDQAELAIRKGIVEVRDTQFLMQPWREDTYARPSNWFFHCKIFIEHLPLYAWCKDGVLQAIGDVCSFDYIEPVSFTQENTEILQCWVWMWHPDQLPRSKLTTVFPEGAGRSRPGVTVAAPMGGMVNLIIHLDSYLDWTPAAASRTPSSHASGRPSSTSSRFDGRSFPFFQEFVWCPGMLDGRATRAEAPRHRNTYRGASPVRRDQDLEDEDRRDPRRHWELWAVGCPGTI